MACVAIHTPTSGSVKATYTSSLLGMVLYYLDHPIPGREEEERRFSYEMTIGSVIVQARELAVDSVLFQNEATHLLFIDDDNGFQADVLNIALSRKKPVVLANYRRKTPPWTFTAIKDGKEVVERLGTPDLEEVDFGGFGFCLIEVAVLWELNQPRFLNQWKQNQSGKWQYTTEDYTFFEKVREAGFPVLVDHRISERVWHVGEYVYKWSDKGAQSEALDRWPQGITAEIK